MLLAIDAGNSNIKFGLFDGSALLSQWRLQTLVGRTADEYAAQLASLLARNNLQLSDITGVAIASVVPRCTPDLVRFSRQAVGVEALVVSSDVITTMRIQYQPPTDVGPDRLVDCVAALDAYCAPCIVVDFGTATTMNALGVSTDPAFQAEYLGGAICPGIGVSLDALYARAARLAAVEIGPPICAIGRDTVGALRSGVVFGYAAQVDGLVRRMQAEMQAPKCPVIATGGHLLPGILDHSDTITAVEPTLTLKGLRLLFESQTGGS